MSEASASGWSRLRRGASSRLRTGVASRARATAGSLIDKVSGRGPANPPLPEQPLVSVVVPMYQVEPWLAESLDSLLAQTHTHLQVVLVDDGSTDRTAEVARGYVERDARFTLVQQPNAGLGAARNTGLQHVVGDLVTFLDSDDTLPPKAYRTMVQALRESGSDFAVGSYKRDDAGRLRTRQWLREVHSKRRLGTTVDESPEVLGNVFAWTKMFRREFVERTHLRFPEGVRYEDQVPMTRAYVEARAFDILPEPVYHWRKRDDGTSITQQKADERDLHDRLHAKREIADMLVELASDEVLTQWYAKVLRFDLQGYMREGLRADESYWKTLSRDVAALLERAPGDIDEHVDARFRVAAWLTAHNRRDTLGQLLGLEDTVSSNFALERDGGDDYVRIDVLDAEPDLPRDLLRIRTVDRRLRAALVALDRSRPGWLRIDGVGLRWFTPADDHEVTLSLCASGDGPTLDVGTTVRPDPSANIFANRVHEDHTRSGFTAMVDLRRLAEASTDVRTTWDVDVVSSLGGGTSEARFREATGSGEARLVASSVVDDALVTTWWDDNEGLKIDVRRRFAVLRSHRVTPDARIELDVETFPPAPVNALLVGSTEVDCELVPTSDPAVTTVRVASSDLAVDDLPARVHIECGWSLPARIWLVEPLETVAGGEDLARFPTAITAHRDGMVRVVDHVPGVYVDELHAGPDRVEVVGRAHALDVFELRLKGPRAESEPVRVEAVGGRFTAVLSAAGRTWGGRVARLPANLYRVTAQAGSRELDARAGLLELDPGDGADREHSPWTVEVTERRAVVLRLGTSSHPEHASAYHQQQVRERHYEPARRAARTDTVFLQCFGGETCGDSPRAVFDLLRERRPDLDLVWSVRDPAVLAPEGGRAVLRHTEEWWRLLGTSRYLVNNSNFVPRFRKAQGQVYLQTWHGTPLKRVGLDMAHDNNFNESYLRLMAREAQAWDYLVSPSPFCTEVLPRALGYAGKVLEIGYPRNDVLVRDDGTVREQVRRELGIDADQTVLLYAPTWRENVRQGGGYAKVLHLDAEEVTRARPDVTVLVRGHANTYGRSSVRGSRVVDVTAYPDVSRLYLAADRLVTDYSSVFFDFALTDKPMTFLVPDLEDYRDRLRGFYLDFEQTAPGPVVRSTTEVLEHLDDDPSQDAARRHSLRERFAPHDDGRATERLVQAVFDDAG